MPGSETRGMTGALIRGLGLLHMRVPLKMVVAFSIVLTTIAAMGAVLFLNMQAVKRSEAAGARTIQVLQAAEAARFALARQENSLRGYLLTGEPYYLRRIETVHRPAYVAAAERLQDLAAGDAEMNARLQVMGQAHALWETRAMAPAIALAAEPGGRVRAAALIGEAGLADRLIAPAEDVLDAVRDEARAALMAQNADNSRVLNAMEAALILASCWPFWWRRAWAPFWSATWEGPSRP